MSVSHPKFAVAVIVLRQKHDVDWEVLMVARKDDHSRWSLPGGKLDPAEPPHPPNRPNLRFAETPRKAATRELREETGVDCLESHLVELETVLDSGGYLTTFYLLAANHPLPDKLQPQKGEAPVKWGPPELLFRGPFGEENRARFAKIGIE
jgi:8-oxo-dGTP pyrophosphatase MutT (NUDIX family)